MDRDDAVRSTNDDALVCKLSAATTGYLADPFVSVLLKRLPHRVAPIMHRGTYVRTAALDALVARFMGVAAAAGRRSQVVSLGAGSDTRFLLLKEGRRNPGLYVEIDFPQITSKKAMALARGRTTKPLLGDFQVGAGGAEIIAQDYWLLAGDLRNFASEILPRLVRMGLQPSEPTLFLSECVMIYLDPTVSDAIVAAAASEFSAPFFVTYEQILPDDAFGRVMISNLKARNIELPGIFAHPTLHSQVERYMSAGFTVARAIDINEVWDKHISLEEKARLARLEIFDEVEEWVLLSRHYCISWTAKVSDGSGLSQELALRGWLSSD
ncbi:carboxy methyl transferase for protein phosphatase 2A [Polyrhizophydium stewartii]|uniref:Leucine carboxyl methyltransferase 1 n=1 Tax=Polyrhizophydium stewartii TaxID=2732419 RepID=A0ABR4NFT6_9FUNG